VPAGAVGFKGAQKAAGTRLPGTRGLMRVPDEARQAKRNQAMNMRAAEASVSSVPTPMKILPIREL